MTKKNEQSLEYSFDMPAVDLVSRADKTKFKELLPNFLIVCHNLTSKDKYPTNSSQFKDMVELLQSRQDAELEAFAADYIATAPAKIKEMISLPWLLERLARFGQLRQEDSPDSGLRKKQASARDHKTKTVVPPTQPATSGAELAERVKQSMAMNKSVFNDEDYKLLKAMGIGV